MTNKLKYFVGNWKMFGDIGSIKILRQISLFCAKFKKKVRNHKIIICVPNTLIYSFKKKVQSNIISIGAQNCHHHPSYGAFTGSVNALMLKNIGAEYVILGHSENRSKGESTSLIKKKIQTSLNINMNVIFCIGETLKEKNRKKTFSVLRKQIKGSIEKKFNINKIIIAYEPIWSIGTGKIPSVYDLNKTFKFIKNEFKKIFRSKPLPTVLYGGSVNDKNIGIFSSISEIDGFLVGAASRSPKKFIDIIKNYYK